MKSLTLLISICCFVAVQSKEDDGTKCHDLFRDKLFGTDISTEHLPAGFPILDLSSTANPDYIATDNFIKDVFQKDGHSVPKCQIKFEKMVKCIQAFLNDGARSVLATHKIRKSAYAVASDKHITPTIFHVKAKMNCRELTSGEYTNYFDEEIKKNGRGKAASRILKMLGEINEDCGSPSMTGAGSSNSAPEDQRMNRRGHSAVAPGMSHFGHY